MDDALDQVSAAVVVTPPDAANVGALDDAQFARGPEPLSVAVAIVAFFWLVKEAESVSVVPVVSFIRHQYAGDEAATDLPYGSDAVVKPPAETWAAMRVGVSALLYSATSARWIDDV
jgi:hypothetical protein